VSAWSCLRGCRRTSSGSELRAPRELLDLPAHAEVSHYDLLLLNQVADRWSIDTTDGQASEEPSACMWFEIDRHVREPLPVS
jgi:hypothetical protein